MICRIISQEPILCNSRFQRTVTYNYTGARENA